MHDSLHIFAWRTLIQDSVLTSKHLDEAAGNDPSFILESNWPIPDQRHFIDFFDHGQGEVISNTFRPINFPTTAMSLTDSCKWIALHACMQDSSRRVFVCNPFTRQ
ncbi:hypothetical protein V6N13_069729 [Hibiscus sabdariffa]|uniref:Uncharacterized protein n=1 Tax=Hibiscus sabdariffa TaxID=183260 RepID=A0ABR2PHH7_9ROSI